MKDNHYVDNDEMLSELVKYRELYKKWEENGSIKSERPGPSERLGEMFVLIATNYAKKGNFSGYTWKSDMIFEAVLTCLKYLHNFDTEKYSNPFSYFTCAIHRVFLTYIKKQKKHSTIKDELYEKYENMEDDYNTFGPKAINYEDFK